MNHFDTYFTIIYGIILCLLTILSLSGLINKTILFFKIAAFILSAIFMTAIVGFSYVVYQNGLRP